jgi:hypothetical protein
MLSRNAQSVLSKQKTNYKTLEAYGDRGTSNDQAKAYLAGVDTHEILRTVNTKER